MRITHIALALSAKMVSFVLYSIALTFWYKHYKVNILCFKHYNIKLIATGTFFCCIQYVHMGRQNNLKQIIFNFAA